MAREGDKTNGGGIEGASVYWLDGSLGENVKVWKYSKENKLTLHE